MYFYYGLTALYYLLFSFSQGVALGLGISGFSAVADQLKLAALQGKKSNHEKFLPNARKAGVNHKMLQN